MDRAYYSNDISSFQGANPTEVLGQMARQHGFDLTGGQRDAWIEQTHLLQEVLAPYNGKLYFEFSIPRMGKRIDALIVIKSVIFVIEFKVGASEFLLADLDQVTDYALDLRNFHEGSHNALIVPVLVSTETEESDPVPSALPEDKLFASIRTNSEGLASIFTDVLQVASGQPLDIPAWESSGYKPTPTIIEATLALYNRHSVAEISRSEGGAINLSKTSSLVADIIRNSRDNSDKAIVFVTGVPGAGKTLVGLNIATSHINKDDDLYSVFLSGNGPLVDILQEALARDKIAREKERGNNIKKGAVRSEVKAFIQNVHHFRDEGLIDRIKSPVEHVALFDEAQRAWTLEKTVDFMKRKKGLSDFNQSEPEFLISCMDRHKDWAVVVCLVGGGQEIHTGEAGIGEWLDALNRSFPDWKIYVSDKLVDSEYGEGKVVQKLKGKEHVEFKSDLHLRTSIRSFRSENVSYFVKQLLDLEIDAAKGALGEFQDKYPIALTRNFDTARKWLRAKARGSERYGIIVSSQAERLKPYAIHVKAPMKPVYWFLNGKDDVRSSYYLEDVATEFHVQGLELDWACVAWDADFRYVDGEWRHWSFRATSGRESIRTNGRYIKKMRTGCF